MSVSRLYNPAVARFRNAPNCLCWADGLRAVGQVKVGLRAFGRIESVGWLRFSDTGRKGQLWLQDHGQDVWFRNLRWREIPKHEVIMPEPYFEPMPVTGQALAKEEARVKAMLEAKEKAANQ